MTVLWTVMKWGDYKWWKKYPHSLYGRQPLNPNWTWLKLASQSNLYTESMAKIKHFLKVDYFYVFRIKFRVHKNQNQKSSLCIKDTKTQHRHRTNSFGFPRPNCIWLIYGMLSYTMAFYNVYLAKIAIKLTIISITMK